MIYTLQQQMQFLNNFLCTEISYCSSSLIILQQIMLNYP